MTRLQVSSAICLVVLLFVVCLVPFAYMPDAVLHLGRFTLQLNWLVFFPAGGALLFASGATFLKEERLPVLVGTTLALAGSLALSCVVAEHKAIAISTVAGFLLRCVAASWVAFIAGRDETLRRKFVVALVALGAVVAFGALFEALSGHFFLFERARGEHQSISELWLPGRHIAIGAIGQPLPLSAALNLLLPFSLWRWAKSRRPGDLIASILMVFGVLMTFRRSAYIVMLVSSAVVLVSVRRELWKAALALLLVCGSAVMAIPSARQQILDRFNPSFTEQEIRSGHRMKVYAITRDIVRAHPVLGLGTRQYELSFFDWARYPGVINTQDSQYLRMAAENGLVGLVALLSFAVFLLKALWRLREGDGLPFLVSCAGFLATLSVLDGFYWPAPAMIFFAVAGLGSGRADQAR